MFRSIAQEGDDLYVVTHGYGTGVLPWLNETAAGPTWKLTDLGIRRELNPYNVLGYPMDEMNAAAGIGGQPNATPPDGTANGVLGSGIGNPSSADIGLNPTQPAPQLQAGGATGISGNKPVRYLSRWDGNNSPASVFDAGARPAQFILPDQRSSSAGLADWITTLAGVDPRNPTQPPPQVGQIQGFYRDDLTQPWFVQSLR